MGYVVPEGESVDVVLNVNGGGTLERNIMVQLTVDGGATEGKYHPFLFPWLMKSSCQGLTILRCLLV